MKKMKWLFPVAIVGSVAYYLFTKAAPKPVAPEEGIQQAALLPLPTQEAVAIAPVRQQVIYADDPRVVTILQESLTPEEYDRAATDETFLAAVTDMAEAQIAVWEQSQ